MVNPIQDEKLSEKLSEEDKEEEEQETEDEVDVGECTQASKKPTAATSTTTATATAAAAGAATGATTGAGRAGHANHAHHHAHHGRHHAGAKMRVNGLPKKASGNNKARSPSPEARTSCPTHSSAAVVAAPTAAASTGKTSSPAAVVAPHTNVVRQVAAPSSPPQLRSQMKLSLQREQVQQEEALLKIRALRESTSAVQQQYNSVRKFVNPVEQSRKRLLELTLAEGK